MRDLEGNEAALSRDLLDWYDVHARDMPWRVPPSLRKSGVQPDPYSIWLSEVMLQQTTVAAVRAYFARFTARWPTVKDLAQAEDADVMAEWAGLGYYARARNLLKCARKVMSDHAGQFPDTHAELLDLPGIGPYTAAAIASIAFDQPHAVLDGNVERVMSRLHDIHDPLPGAKPAFIACAQRLTPDARAGDYAQAVMDLGATICTPRSPACGICPWRDPCTARARGTAEGLPRKAAKKPKPIRHGIVYVARREDGAWLLETRPETGLLGGMLGWPGSEWTPSGGTLPETSPPAPGDWQPAGAEVRHTFTHFHLRLSIYVAVLPADTPADRGSFLPAERFRPTDLPTVMRKAFDLARDSLKIT